MAVLDTICIVLCAIVLICGIIYMIRCILDPSMAEYPLEDVLKNESER